MYVRTQTHTHTYTPTHAYIYKASSKDFAETKFHSAGVVKLQFSFDTIVSAPEMSATLRFARSRDSLLQVCLSRYKKKNMSTYVPAVEMRRGLAFRRLLGLRSANRGADFCCDAADD